MHPGRLRDDRELPGRQFGIAHERRTQGARRGQFRQQQGLPRGLVELEIVGCHARLAEELRDHLLVDVRVLAQVHRGEVEAEAAHGAAQPAQASVGQPVRIARAQAGIDHVEVGSEGGRIGIGLALAHRGAVLALQAERGSRCREAGEHAGQRTTVRFVLPEGGAVRRGVHERRHRRRELHQQPGDRQLRTQRMHLAEVVVEGDLGLAPEGMLEHLGGDEGIAVAVAADPAADGEHRGESGHLPLARQPRQRVLDVAVQARHGIDEGVVEVRERVLDLVLHAQLHGPQHARLPERGDDAAQLALGALAFLVEEVGLVALREPAGYGELQVQGAAPLHFRRVRGEHGSHADALERGRALGARRAPREGVREQAAQGRGQRRGSGAAILPVAADVVAVLGDVGEHREVAERAHHHHRLAIGEGIQGLGQRAARGDILEAPAGHREPADRLDQLVGLLALVQPDGFAQDAAEEADVLGERRVLFGRDHGATLP